ncbi:MAG: hypothetical protein ACYST6_19580, partial [Planctomycetota bacterium]
PTSLRPPIAQKCSRTGIVSLYSARYANPVKIISSTSNSALAAVNPYSQTTYNNRHNQQEQ